MGEVPRPLLIEHAGLQTSAELYGFALFSVIMMGILFMRMGGGEEEEKDVEDGKAEEEKDWSIFERAAERMDDGLVLTFSMSFAWAVFFCTRMNLAQVPLL